ncbi:MAG: MmgE/PrpD family protein [Salinirussus sp.]
MTDDIGQTTGALAEYLSKVTFADLPDEVIERARWHLLDTLGCIAYGLETPWVGAVVDALGDLGEIGHGPASIPTTGIAVSPARATLVGGTAAHAMDFDDYCQDAGVHAGSAVLPAIFARAETRDEPVDGRAALTAMAAATEVGIRTGYGIGRGSLARGWHIAGWTGAVAGAAAASVLGGLDRETTAHAIAIAATQGAGLMGATYGASVKRFHMGKAAESGYLGAILADNGLTGDTKLFKDRWGSISTTMAADGDPGAVTDALGERYTLLETLTLKPYPSVGQTHPAITGVESILTETEINGEDVDTVEVHVTDAAKDKSGWEYEPTGVMAAQSNIQYAIATLLLEGRLSVHDYTDEAIRRPAVLDRVDDITVRADDALVTDASDYNARYATRVIVQTRDGDRHERRISVPKGFPENPLSPSQLEAKFRDQAGAVLDSSAVETAIDRVADLEACTDVTDLLTILRDGRPQG